MEMKISDIPTNPGIYIFKNDKEQVLYVGKAKNLRNRIKSYFNKSSIDSRKSALVKETKDISYIVTDNELEAFVLEANLIKQHKPKFNIILRDDKNYPYIKLTINEEWPRLEVVRRFVKDGALYFGPYVPAGAMWDTIDFIRKNFQIRDCSVEFKDNMKPCLQYQIGRCSAPCAGMITRNEYMKTINNVKLFLNGERKSLIGNLRKKMIELSKQMKFEEAAIIRDKINSIEKTWESQKIVSPGMEDIDIIGIYRGENGTAFKVLFLRKGLMIGSKDYFIKDSQSLSNKELIQSFIIQFYSKDILPAKEIIVEVLPENVKSIEKWLKSKSGENVRILMPDADRKKELVNMASENAKYLYNSKSGYNVEQTLQELMKRLNIVEVPQYIGAFDISNISGNEAVGSFIVWAKGEFRKEMYRRLKIKTVHQVDDYAMMREVLGRVINNLEGNVPDLIIIDGGRGHLETACRVFEENQDILKKKPFIISIAKKPDRVFLPLSDVVIDLEDRSPSSLLMKSIRDEAHRFAISYHRKLRGEEMLRSPLESLKGIGKKRRLELLRSFGSIKRIRDATIEEIAHLKGFNRKLAEEIKQNIGRTE